MTDEPTVEELEAQYREKLQAKLKAFEAEEQKQIQAQKEKDEQAKMDEFKASIINEIRENLLGQTESGNDGSDNGVDTGDDTPETPITSEPSDENSLFATVSRDTKLWASKHGVKVSGIPKYDNENFMKNYVKYGLDMFKATDSDDGCEDDVSAWENEDFFVDAIWFDLICSSDFLGKIGHRVYDYQKGAGGQVQVKLISIPSPAHDWGDAASLDPCECISCVSNAFSTYTVQIKKYGDMREICNADLLLAGDEVKTAVLESMRIRLAERIDNEIWTNIAASTGTYTVSLDSECSNASRGTDADCCTWSVNLFDDIIDLHAQMWNAGYFRKSNPVLIINKTVSALLKYKDGLSPQIKSALKFNGTALTGIGEIQVIESCHAPTCADSVKSDVIAVLIDPDRAFAEVWAQRPKYESDRNIDCDSTTHVVWAYGAFDVLDNDAIGTILNDS